MLPSIKREFIHLHGVTQGGGGERRGRELENELEEIFLIQCVVGEEGLCGVEICDSIFSK